MNINLYNSSIWIVGSSNTDMVIRTNVMPRPGETVIGSHFFMNPGGKGANQAVAAARLGANVKFVCKTGNDIFGYQSNQLFIEEGIDVSYVLSDTKSPSGVALITVDNNAENCIVVAPGANANLLPADIQGKDIRFESDDFIMMQLEIPLETVKFVADIAYNIGAKIVLNPAPAQSLPYSLLSQVWLLTPNETEAEIISGIKIVDQDSANSAIMKIVELGVKNVIVTLGRLGALVYSEDKITMVRGYRVDAIDTTGAGDVFNGALLVALSEGHSVVNASDFACRAAAISVTRDGAQASIPYRGELDVFCAPKYV